MTTVRQLLEAVSFAARAHHGQMRKDHATPYVSHAFRVCLTFLEFEFEEFREKYPLDKVIEVVQKTWKKTRSLTHGILEMVKRRRQQHLRSLTHTILPVTIIFLLKQKMIKALLLKAIS